MNHGFIYEEPKPEDWVAGSGKVTKLLGAADLNPSGDWTPYNPNREHQKRGLLETSNCTNFGTHNALIALAKFHGLPFPHDCSERYSGVMTKTTKNGNTPNKVIETIRKEAGAIHESVLPWTDDIRDWDEYYFPNPMTQEYVNLGKSLLKQVKIWHEWVFNGFDKTPGEKRELLKKYLKRGAVCVSVDAWTKKGNLYVKKPRADDGHWVWLVRYDGDNPVIRDQYEPFEKTLAADYDFQCAKVYFMSKNTDSEVLSIFKKILLIAREWLGLIDESTEPPKPEPTPEPKKDYIRLWALAIQEFEGWYQGSHSYRLNNPGNLKSLSGKFISYPTYTAGFAALKDYLTRACTGRHKAYKPEMTLYEAMGVYAPDGPKIQQNYSVHCAKKMGVSIMTKLKELV